MKDLRTSIYVAGLALLSLASCKDSVRSLNPDLTPVTVLSAPTDQASVKLDPTSNAVVQFKWEPTKAADGDPVLYEVAFDKTSGDFSKPFYKTVSDGGGVQNQLTITHKLLAKVASVGGIASSSTGSIKWTVVTSKAANSQVGTSVRTLTLQRPAGFIDLPVALYLTGTATEAGEDLTKAISFKKIEDGVFELHTSLKAGTYLLTDKPDATGKKYFLNQGVIQEGSTAVLVNGETKVYRLRFDFNVATSQLTELKQIGLYMSAYDKEIGTLTYAGNSTWTSAPIAVEFYQFSWGRDERYKFILHTADGLEYLGSENVNNVSPVGVPADYFYLLPVTNAQWDNTYKFNPAADRKNVKVTLSFPANAPYAHSVAVFN